MRAHLNCLENLPIYGAIVLVIVVSGAQSPALDALAITLIGARVAQTSIHVSAEQTNLLASLRFGFFFIQLICMLSMTTLVVLHAIQPGRLRLRLFFAVAAHAARTTVERRRPRCLASSGGGSSPSSGPGPSPPPQPIR